MNIASVKLFLEVLDAGSLSKVAARRQTVQSHISRQITEFERGFGAPLFRRTGRGVAPTELGLRVARRLRGWLQDTERLQEELISETGQLLGEVRIGLMPSAAHPLMTRVFQRVSAEHPGVRLQMVEAQGGEIDAMLDSGLVDLAILFRYNRPTGREEKLLCVAHTYLVSAPEDPLTAAPSLDFRRLDGLSLVLPRRPGRWRAALDEAATSMGMRLTAAVEADSLTVQKELAMCTPGLYAVLGPFAVARELREGTLRTSQLVRPDLVRHVTLAMPRQGKLSPACRLVAELIQDIIASWGDRLDEPLPA